MNWAFNLGKILGIKIRIHYFFVLFVGILIVPQVIRDFRGNTLQAPFLLILILLLFGFVLLHELGHSVMARRLGVKVVDITLWPLGGIARLGQIPEKPAAELLIAIAGPLVNIAIVLLLLPLAWISTPDLWAQIKMGRPTSFLSMCMLINLFMAGFNFIPAFPMDGGRVLRALLGYRMSFVQATRNAVRVGRIFAVSFILVGLIYPGWGMLLLIGPFILITGARELRAVQWRSVFGRMQAAMESGNDGEDRTGPDTMPEQIREAMARGNLEDLQRALERTLRRPPQE